MKALKVLGVTILVVAALIFIIPMFMADTTTVSAKINIKSTAATVFRQVNKLKNWENWSPFESDSSMISTYEGSERGVGSKRHWIGEKAGDGNMTILESQPYEKIVSKLEFGDGSGGEGRWQFKEINDSLNVVWALEINNLSYPMGKLMAPVMGMILRPSLEKGLRSLKEFSESETDSPEVSVVEINKIISLAIYDSAKINDIGNLMEKNYGKLMTYIKARNYSISGAPFAVYHNWNPMGYTRISAAIPLRSKNIKEKKEIQLYEIEAGKAVYAKHFGSYDTEKTHEAIMEYIKDFNLQTKDFVWESYITDSISEPDTSKWQTNIYYPLK